MDMDGIGGCGCGCADDNEQFDDEEQQQPGRKRRSRLGDERKKQQQPNAQMKAAKQFPILPKWLSATAQSASLPSLMWLLNALFMARPGKARQQQLLLRLNYVRVLRESRLIL